MQGQGERTFSVKQKRAAAIAQSACCSCTSDQGDGAFCNGHVGCGHNEEREMETMEKGRRRREGSGHGADNARCAATIDRW